MLPTESGAQTRDININIRAKRLQRDLIDQAAGLLGKTRSDFIFCVSSKRIQSICPAAHLIIA